MKINNGLISVSDKKGILDFSKKLLAQGISLYSTGGTYTQLKKLKEIAPLEKLSPFPEILNGRVKTLQPQIHAGILFDRDNPNHVKTIKEKNIIPLDLVVVNLYPFEKKVKANKNHEEILENIDIGGVTLLRAAAKNHKWVTVICEPADYQLFLKEIAKTGKTSLTFREKLASKAFQHTHNYEEMIAGYFQKKVNKVEPVTLRYSNQKELRYGENPHQKADFFFNSQKGKNNLGGLKILHGKEMSYNNYLDVEAALKVKEDFTKENLAVIIKHQNACGLSVSSNLNNSLELAWQGDLISAFGSIVLLNGEVTPTIANFFKDKFIEIILAENFNEKALSILQKKKNLRIIQFSTKKTEEKYEYRVITNGMLRQEKNQLLYTKLVLQNQPQKAIPASKQKLFDFAIKSIKKIKSNAIVIAMEFKKNAFMLVGMGCGQPNRLDAMQLALTKAEMNLKRLFPKNYPKKINECVLVSDAFFPFKDNIELANQFGIKNIIEPGGSIRDQEVIDTSKKYNIKLYFSHMRHFYH